MADTAPYTPAPPTSPREALALLPAITALRLRYLRSGYTPLPCIGKKPVLPNWSEARIDALQVQAWGAIYRGALNVGVRTTYSPAVDIDVLDIDMVHAIESVLPVPPGKITLRRVGRAPKRLIPFCCLVPFEKRVLAFASPDAIVQRVEVLGRGQQYIAEGWHPDTSEPYAWLGDKLVDVLPTRLPMLTGALADKFLAEVRAIVAARGWAVVTNTERQGDANRLWPKPNGNGRDPAEPARNSAYARAALDAECLDVEAADEGTRNDTLNRAAFNLFQLVAGGELDEGEVVERLTEAAGACGLTDDDGAKSVARTIASGGHAGRREPRQAPSEDDGNAAIECVEQRERHDPDKPDEGSPPGGGSGSTAPAPPPAAHIRRAELVPFATVRQRAIEWAWQPRLARGKIALVTGDPGVGKSALADDIAARISAGKMWPDGGFAPAGNCVILSAEDAADDTIGPRLVVAGADMDRVLLLRMTGGKKHSAFNLAQDLPLLATAFEQLGNVVLLAIDPVTAYLGDKIDTHQTAAVRAVLEPLDAFAAQHRCAILGVTHPPKAAQAKAVNSFTGSLAFVAAARTAFVAVPEPETDRRLLLPVKSNIGPLAPGLAYRIEPTTTADRIETIRIQWDSDPVDITASEAIYTAAEEARSRNQTSEAEEFLEAFLATQPMPSEKVRAAAEANSIAWRTIERAKKRLRVVAEKDGFQGTWVWRLPR